MAERRCQRCGDTGPEQTLGWSSTIESGEERALCASCTRAHVRDIESKLDEAWWSPEG